MTPMKLPCANISAAAFSLGYCDVISNNFLSSSSSKRPLLLFLLLLLVFILRLVVLTFLPRNADVMSLFAMRKKFPKKSQKNLCSFVPPRRFPRNHFLCAATKSAVTCTKSNPRANSFETKRSSLKNFKFTVHLYVKTRVSSNALAR